MIGCNQAVINAQHSARDYANANFKAGDAVKLTASHVVNDRIYVGVVAEYEFTCHDGMCYILVKAKGQRKPRSLCVNPRDLVKA